MLHCGLYKCTLTHTHSHSQVIRENGTHFAVTFQISNLTSLANIDPATNVTAQQAVDLITSSTIGSNLLPFQIQINPNVSITPSFFVLGRGPEVMTRCENDTDVQPQPCNCTDNTPNMTICPNTTDSNPMSCNCSDSMANTTQSCNNITEFCPQCNCTSDNILPCPNNTDNNMCPKCNCSTTMSECTFNVTQCKNYCSQNNLTSTGSSCNTTTTNITNRLGLSSGAVAGIAIALFILGAIVGILLQLVLVAAIRWCRNNCTSVNFKQPIKYKKHEESISLS